jgi:hypothetical protein
MRRPSQSPSAPASWALAGKTVARIKTCKRYRDHNALPYFGRLIRWRRLLLRQMLVALTATFQPAPVSNQSSSRTTN